MKFKFDGRNRTGPVSVFGKIASCLFFAIFACFGIFFIVMMMKSFSGGIKTYSWSKTPCIIQSSSVTEGGKGQSDHLFNVKYTYRIDESDYSSSTYKRGYKGTSDYSATQILAGRYPEGSSAECYVNPSDLNEAVLEREQLWVMIFLLIPLVFVAIGFGGVISICKGGIRTSTASRKPISSEAAGGKGEFGLTLFFLVFFLAGSAFFYAFFLNPFFKIREAKAWDEAPCTVISSSVQSHSGSDSTTYSIEVFYSYSYEGNEYKSDRYGFMCGSSSGYKGKKAVVDTMPPGSAQTCYVNPANPSEAVINRGFTTDLLFGLIPLVFVAIGAGGMIFTIRGGKKKKGNKAGADISIRAVTDEHASHGPVDLKSTGSPLAKFIGFLIFALIWNGVISAVLYHTSQGWKNGDHQWGLVLFLIPFVLVGVGVIALTLYQLLAIFNPRAVLTVSRADVALGDDIDLSWTIRGKVSRLSEMKISLIGSEEATYRRGTDTRTDTYDFLTTDVITVADPLLIRDGHVTLSLPAESMHSFESSNNSITWEIKVTGDIPFWPDVSETYRLHVLPLRRRNV